MRRSLRWPYCFRSGPVPRKHIGRQPSTAFDSRTPGMSGAAVAWGRHAQYVGPAWPGCWGGRSGTSNPYPFRLRGAASSAPPEGGGGLLGLGSALRVVLRV